jgi:hypothetical protein
MKSALVQILPRKDQNPTSTAKRPAHIPIARVLSFLLFSLKAMAIHFFWSLEIPGRLKHLIKVLSF